MQLSGNTEVVSWPLSFPLSLDFESIDACFVYQIKSKIDILYFWKKIQPERMWLVASSPLLLFLPTPVSDAESFPPFLLQSFHHSFPRFDSPNIDYTGPGCFLSFASG